MAKNGVAMLFGLVVAAGAGAFGAFQVSKFLDQSRPAADNRAAEQLLQPVRYEPSAPLPAGSVDFRSAARRVTPSVVSVDRYERQMNFFGEPGAEAETGTGSGVVISADGIIVTNNHVVADADRVRVRFGDGKMVDAKVVGTDPTSDLAVLRVESKNLSPIQFAASKDVEIGQWVMAVGNPLGFDNTVSVGVVSSLKRSLPTDRQGNGLVDAIQTDAAINPGNSGGALCDAEGRLIGINSAIASSTGQSIGIGFAVPVDRVRSVASDILKFGYARYASLGILTRRRLDGALAYTNVRRELAGLAQQEDASKVPMRGIIVVDASPETKRAGIDRWDIITAIDGVATDGTFDLNRALVPKKPGDQVEVSVWSRGQAKKVRFKLQEARRR